MNLILWRHAEADDTSEDGNDMARALTARGQRQAKRIAGWLDRHLPDDAQVLASPALRAEQTAKALERKFKTQGELAPDGTVAQLLDLVQWRGGSSTFLVVGHQPVLGETVARLLGIESGQCAIRKGALWWLQQRLDRDGEPRTTVVAVFGPDLI